MRFVRLELQGFGRFSGLDLQLGPGLNLVVGPNETGKTTLVNALLGVLYGLRGRSGHLRELRERYRPWSGGPYQAALTLEDSGGRAFRVDRDFEADKVEVWRGGPGGWSHAGAGELKRLLEEDLGLPTAHLFLSTLLLRQQEVAALTQDRRRSAGGSPTGAAQDVGEALVARITEGEEDVPARKALDALDRRLKEVTWPGATKNPGLLEVLARDIGGLEAELAQMEGRLGEYQGKLEARGRLEAELGRATTRRDLLSPTVKGLDRLQRLQASLEELRARHKGLERRRRQIAEARERLADCERALEATAALGRYLAEVEAGRSPDIEALAAERRASAGEAGRHAAALEQAAADLEQLEARRDQARQEAGRLEAELGAGPEARSRIRSLARALAAAGASSPPGAPGAARGRARAGWVAAGLAVGAVAAAAGVRLLGARLFVAPPGAGAPSLGAGGVSPWVVLAGAAALGAVVGGLLAWALAGAFGARGEEEGEERERKKKELHTQPRPPPHKSHPEAWGAERMGRLEGLEAQVERDAAAIDARRKLLSEQEEQAARARTRLAGLESGLARALEQAGQPGLEAFSAALKERRRREAERDAAASALKALLDQGSEADLEDGLDSLAAEVRTQQTERQELAGSLPPLGPQDIVELKDEHGRLEQAVPDLARQLAAAAAEVGSYERLALGRDPWEVRARLAAAHADAGGLEREAEALRLACGLLDEAAKDARGQAAAGLHRQVGEALGYITGGRYREARVEAAGESVGVWVMAPETGKWVEPERLSTGTSDQVFFALRLALAEYLTGGRGFPLVLDDPFVNFDSPRLGRTLDLLQGVARTHQVLWLTKDEPLARACAAAGAGLRLLTGVGG